jgi:tRNA modification GTPase
MSAADGGTVVVELTPQGRGAVAVVVVEGPHARDAVRQFFVPIKTWGDGDPKIGRISFGRWGGECGEELIVCRRGADNFEIHCHGGGAAAPAIIGQLVSRGCRRVKWQEWVCTNFQAYHECIPSASRRDAATVDAQVALASATTLRAAAVLLDQYHGALSREVDAARGSIGAADWARAGAILEDALRYRDVGLHLTSPWRVVLAGPPNVGKSSLVNAIAGYQRAIVSPTPGTTRDVVTVNTAIDGWPVHLADTAGLRATDDELESAGVALASAEIRAADLVVLVSDAVADETDEDIIASARGAARVMRVRNKADLLPDRERAGDSPNLVSALTGEGVPNLITAIGKALVPEAPPAGVAVPFTRQQIANLEAARQAVLDRDARRADAALAALLAFE